MTTPTTGPRSYWWEIRTDPTPIVGPSRSFAIGRFGEGEHTTADPTPSQDRAKPNLLLMCVGVTIPE